MSRSLASRMWSFVALVMVSLPFTNARPAAADDAQDHAESQADQALAALSARYATLEQQFRLAISKGPPDDTFRIYKEFDPDNVLVDEYLAFEQNHRGEHAAVGVLNRICSAAMSVGDPDLPISRARARAVEIAQLHYAEHPDLDALLNGFESGSWLPEAESLLRSSLKSPHAHVRACATVRLASWMWHRISLVQAAKEVTDLADESDADQQHKAYSQGIVATIGELDMEQSRRDAVGLLDQLTEEEAAVEEAVWQASGPGRLLLTRADLNKLNLRDRPTYGKRAESLRFEIENLAPGCPAPEIEGVDADGQELKLSDYRGQVVVLVFSASWCGPCHAMYPDSCKLVEQYRGKPFAFLSVMGDDDREGLRALMREGEINWRAWTDGMSGPITTRWNIRRWPTIYVLDHRGRIAYRNVYEKMLAAAVARLLDQREADPAAEMNTEPPPESPLFREGELTRRKLRRPHVLGKFETGSRHADAVAFTPDGKYLITCGYDQDADPTSTTGDGWKAGKATGVPQLWDVAEGKLLGRLAGTTGVIWDAAVSPDGKLMATGGRVHNHPDAGEVKLWDLATRREIATLSGHTGWVMSVAFSPDGRLLASGGFDKVPRIWEVPSGRLVRELPRHAVGIAAVVFSPGGEQLATATNLGVVNLWDSRTWDNQRSFSRDNYQLEELAFSPDGKWLATCGANDQGEQLGVALLYEVGAEEQPPSELSLPDGRAMAIDFSPDSRLLATLSLPHRLRTTGGVRVFRVADQTEIAIVRRSQSSTLDGMRFLPQGRAIAVNDYLGTVSVWNLAD